MFDRILIFTPKFRRPLSLLTSSRRTIGYDDCAPMVPTMKSSKMTSIRASLPLTDSARSKRRATSWNGSACRLPHRSHSGSSASGLSGFILKPLQSLAPFAVRLPEKK